MVDDAKAATFGRFDSWSGSAENVEDLLCIDGLRRQARSDIRPAGDHNSANAHSLIGYAKTLLGRGAETEAHISEAFRLSPRDTFAHRWMVWVGLAKVQLNNDAEAVLWLRRSLDANRNYPVAHFQLGGALARLGDLTQARAAVQAGLAIDPGFTIRRYCDATSTWGDNPTFLAGRARSIEGLRLAGVPEG